MKADYGVLEGDNVAITKSLDAECVDLVVTSPPYDDLRAYGGHSWDFEGLTKELFRVVKIGGVVVWVVADGTKDGSESGTSFRQALFFMSLGFRLHDTMVYAKNSYMPKTHRRYEQAFEYMFVFSKGSPSAFNPIMEPCLTAGSKRARGGAKQLEAQYAERRRDERTIVSAEKQHSNIFFYDVGKNEKTAHNAPFPLELAVDAVTSWSNEGASVYDPFCGSGTTGVAALKNNRAFLGAEINPEYITIARNRLAPFFQ